jgi:hypothetical protein
MASKHTGHFLAGALAIQGSADSAFATAGQLMDDRRINV